MQIETHRFPVVSEEAALAERLRPAQPFQRSSFALRPAQVCAERILRIQGYSDLTRVRPVIQRAAHAMAQAAMSLSAPQAAYRRVAIHEIRAEALVLRGGTRLHCSAFEGTLRGCTEVAPFVLTVGTPLAERVMELADAGDLLEGLLLETAGWLCIEDATRQFKTQLREAALARGMRITSRLGPGYSYKVRGVTSMWRLEEQAVLFALLGEGDGLPVTLMDSCAMRPKLSRSGMYGIGPLLPGEPAATHIHHHPEEQVQ